MRGRPDVEIKIPPVVHPGEEVDIQMSVESRSDTPIDFIDLAFEGDEILSLVVDGDQSRVHSIVHLGTRLRDRGVLNEGKHRFRARFKVPSSAPASYLGVRVTIRYEVRLHIAIPWWPDLKETYEVLVEPHPTPRPKPQSMTATSASGPEPFIELSLTDTAFAPNDEVSGAFAVGNLPQRENEGVEISLVGVELASDGGVNARGAEQFRFIVPTVFQTPKDGGVVPFRFRVPKDVMPSFSSTSCQLLWVVHAALRLPWGWSAACRIPVKIGRHNLPREGSTARPEIGAARWRRLWSEAGLGHGLALSDTELALIGWRGDVQIRVALEESKGEEAALTATLQYPSLELDLQVSPQFMVVMPNDLEAQFESYRIRCRELEQGKAFFSAELRAALAAFKTMRVNDTRTVVRSPGTGHGQPGIGDFLANAAALAEALALAIQRIPPPAAMREALPAWRTFAAATGGRLAAGGMFLAAASIDAALFDVATTFQGEEVSGTRIDMQIDPPLDFRVSMDDADSFTAAPPGSRDFAVALQASVAGLKIHPNAISVELAAPTLDPADLRPRMIEMLMLAKRLRGERTPGPYR